MAAPLPPGASLPPGTPPPRWCHPPHFAREQRQLETAGISTWLALAGLDDATLRRLGRSGGASEARLIRLRGQARLVVEVGLEPAEAALLLHAGLPDRRALAEADPQRLLVQMGRLQRSLTGMAAPMLDQPTLLRWIRQARAAGPNNPSTPAGPQPPRQAGRRETN